MSEEIKQSVPEDPYFGSEFNMYGGPSIYCKMCGAYVRHHLMTKHLEFHDAINHLVRLQKSTKPIL